MRNIIYAIMFSAVALAFGCNNNSNLSISVTDTDAEYTYNASYPSSKTYELEKYLSKELNNNLPMDQNVDASVNLINGEKFNLKATKGVMSIKFDKKNNSTNGYIKMKKFTEGISELLK